MPVEIDDIEIYLIYFCFLMKAVSWYTSLVSPFASPALLPTGSSGVSSTVLPGMLHAKWQEQTHEAALRERLSPGSLGKC